MFNRNYVKVMVYGRLLMVWKGNKEIRPNLKTQKDQRAHLLLRQLEFESRWSLQIFFEIVAEKSKISMQKEAGIDPIFLNRHNKANVSKNK